MNALDQMTEVVLPGKVQPEGLQVRQSPLPEPGPGQALVAVEASGISFAEQQMRRGLYYDQPTFPFVPGYDLVGTVQGVGDGVDPTMIGKRFAALTKIGGWSSHALVEAGDLVPVPAGLDPGDAESVVVNGITAWQMLHRSAKVTAGQTILVLGASGGVGTTLVQLAAQAGIKVIGTASPQHHEKVRALGAIPIDYRDPDVPARVRELAPQGVAAVFDHIGGSGIVDSYRLLAPKGALVAYSSLSTAASGGNVRLAVFTMVARLMWWNLLPNGKSASFYNIWAGRRNLKKFQTKLAEDLRQVLQLMADGAIKPQVAARFPLSEAADAMKLAESRTISGKVVLIP